MPKAIRRPAGAAGSVMGNFTWSFASGESSLEVFDAARAASREGPAPALRPRRRVRRASRRSKTSTSDARAGPATAADSFLDRSQATWRSACRPAPASPCPLLPASKATQHGYESPTGPTRYRGTRTSQVLRDSHRSRRHRLRGGARQRLLASGSQRSRQDHDHPDSLDADFSRRRARSELPATIAAANPKRSEARSA